MAAAITGRSRAPMFTTGPATRGALAAAGALGATTGTVVHLPAVPTGAPAVSAVLAHELAHTRSPVRRPRFLLGGASGLLDDDERQALAAGRAGPVVTAGAGIVDSLPVGGGLGAVGDVATRAARAAVLEAAAGPLGSALGGPVASEFGAGAAGLTGSTFSGSAPPGSAPPGSAFSGSAFSGSAGSGGGEAGGFGSVFAGSAGSGGGEAGGFGSDFPGPGGVGAGPGAASQAAGGTVAGMGHGGGAALDPDKVVEIVEKRLLREIERRGGRWAGVF
jgi:uncharacterized protein DUF4157